MSASETEPPTGLPNEEDEIAPLGVPADEDDDGDPDLPGFPDDGEADTAG
jgi:hypothetical protein